MILFLVLISSQLNSGVMDRVTSLRPRLDALAVPPTPVEPTVPTVPQAPEVPQVPQEVPLDVNQIDQVDQTLNNPIVVDTPDQSVQDIKPETIKQEQVVDNKKWIVIGCIGAVLLVIVFISVMIVVIKQRKRSQTHTAAEKQIEDENFTFQSSESLDGFTSEQLIELEERMDYSELTKRMSVYPK